MSNAWNKFEWDDENKKNGNVQHLREYSGWSHRSQQTFAARLPGQGRSARSRFHGLGTQTQDKEKKMKKRFGKLPKSERLKIEAQYHRMKPEPFDRPMSDARRHSPGAIRLPRELVETLKIMAESEGEPEYQAMVRRWIEERLRQETSAAGRVL